MSVNTPAEELLADDAPSPTPFSDEAPCVQSKNVITTEVMSAHVKLESALCSSGTGSDFGHEKNGHATLSCKDAGIAQRIVEAAAVEEESVAMATPSPAVNEDVSVAELKAQQMSVLTQANDLVLRLRRRFRDSPTDSPIIQSVRQGLKRQLEDSLLVRTKRRPTAAARIFSAIQENSGMGK